MIAHRYLMRAAMAGMVVAVFYIVNYAIVGVFDGLHVGDASLAGIGKLLGALAFGPARRLPSTTRSPSCSPAT